MKQIIFITTLIVGLFVLGAAQIYGQESDSLSNEIEQVENESEDPVFQTGEDEPWALIELVLGAIVGVLMSLVRGFGVRLVQLLEAAVQLLIDFLKSKRSNPPNENT